MRKYKQKCLVFLLRESGTDTIFFFKYRYTQSFSYANTLTMAQLPFIKTFACLLVVPLASVNCYFKMKFLQETA